MVNEAPSELHELVAVLLPEDEDRSVDELVGLPPEEMGPALFAVEPATVLMAAPGGEQIAAVGDGTLSEPGRYAILCVIPTGVEPEVYFAAAAEIGPQPLCTTTPWPDLAERARRIPRPGWERATCRGLLP
ncbi:MAG: hypothetical protein ACLFWR_08215 [Acidimicrobiales bacterium]